MHFQSMTERGIETFLLCQSRTDKEVLELFPDHHDKIEFFYDNKITKFIDKHFKGMIGVALVEFFRVLFMKKHARAMVKKHNITIAQKTGPEHPKAPSYIHDLGCPLIIGPLCGGLEYPKAFKKRMGLKPRIIQILARKFGDLSQWIFRGKREASLLLIAHEFTEKALPKALKNVPCIRPCSTRDINQKVWKYDPNHKRPERDHVEFLCTAHLTADWKAVDLLLQAFQKVIKKTPNVHLNIIGEGDFKEIWEDLAKELEIQDKVTFQGFLPQPKARKQIQNTDVFVLPSIYEPGGTSVLEAMYMARPVITADWGGPSTYVDESCGFAVPVDSVEGYIKGLARSMTQLALFPELRKQMGLNAHDKIVQLYDWNKRVDRMIAIYNKVVSNSLSPEEVELT